MRFAINMTVDRMDAGKSLVEWLAYMLVDETRASVIDAIQEGRVAIDRVPVTDPEVTLTAGVEVSFQQAAEGGAVDWSQRASAGDIVIAPKEDD